jgi:hypothetical protein
MMAFAKQLQLQDDLTGMVRNLLKADGWYDRHVEAQKLFAAILAIVLLGVSALLGSWFRGSTASVKTAAGALWLLVAFVLVRAASFHAMDEWVIRERLGLRVGWWIELAGIAAIGGCALVSLGARKRSF